MRFLFRILLLLCLQVLSAQQVYDIDDVPNPKSSTSNDWVSDPGNFLTPSDKAQINQILKDIEVKSTAQVAVVVLPSIVESEDENSFAYKLFNKWGIGQSDKNNGLLFLMVMDRRRWRFEVGYGLEGSLTDIVTKHIAEDRMVYYFKQEQYGQGIINGMRRVQEVLSDPSIVQEIHSSQPSSDESTNYSDVPPANEMLHVLGFLAFGCLGALVFALNKAGKLGEDLGKKTNPPLGAFEIIFFSLLFPGVLLLFTRGMGIYSLEVSSTYLLYGYYYLSFMVLYYRYKLNKRASQSRDDAEDRFHLVKEKNSSWWWVIILFPIPAVLYVIWYLYWYYRNVNRFKPRDSKSGKPMRRIKEQDDNRFLNKGQITEEEIKSIDYDVWVTADESEVEILDYVNYFSGYSKCPSCSFRTKYLQSNETIRAATYESSGQGKKTYACKHCSYSHVEYYTIPKKTKSSSSGGSSGGSWGGGRSGGGGSSGGW